MTHLNTQSVIMTGLKEQDFAYAGAGCDYFLRTYIPADVVQHALNSPSRYNPYHNNLHTLSVAYHTAAGLMFDTTFGTDKQQAEAERIIRMALVAGLYHDYGHSGGFMPDDDNIKQALIGLRSSPIYREFGPGERTIVSRAIRSTMYMYGEFPNAPVGRLACAIRDADLMMVYDSNMHQTLLGLFEEITHGSPDFEFIHPVTNKMVRLGQQGEADNNYDAGLAWFFIGNCRFLREATMHTRYGILMRRQHLNRSLRVFKELVMARLSFRSFNASEDETKLLQAMEAAVNQTRTIFLQVPTKKKEAA